MNDFDSVLKSEDFDKKEWLEVKKAEKEYAFRLIEDTLENIKKGGDYYKRFLDVLSKFEKYSTGNILLITSQKPEATKLLTSKTIREKSAFINKGEKGIVLIEPGKEFIKDDGSTGVSYKVKKVFDVSQTTIDSKNKGDIKYDNRFLIKSLIGNAPCKFEVSKDSDNDIKAKYVVEDNTIYVSENINNKDIFRALTQELTYAYFDDHKQNQNINSIIAYSTSYTLCNKYGVDTSSFCFENMTNIFKGMETKEVRKELNTVREIVNAITNDMQKVFDRQKTNER